SGDVNEVIKHVVQELKLPPSESYGLIFEEPKAFLTPDNLDRISHGFMLTVTAAPDPCFVACFYSLSNIHLLYDLLADDRLEGSQTCLNLCLRSICSMLDLGVQDIGWNTASTILVIKLATLVTGRAKREDSNVVLIALRMIENLLNSDNATIRLLVLEEVPAQTLIRHLEKSDERVALAALSLMNALHEKSDAPAREQIIKHFASMPFRTAVSGSVLREGRGRNAALLCQLVPLQRLLINESTKFLGVPATESDVDALLAREVVHASASSEEQLKSWADQLLTSPLGKLAVDTFANYADHHAEDLRILVTENSMRSSAAAWQLIPVWMHCISIVASVLGVIPSEEECVEKLIELLFRCDSSLDSLFAVTVQLFHRTWREMHASHDEHDKVANVVHEQLRRAANHRPTNLNMLEDLLLALPYWKMKELWKRELIEKENNQLGSECCSSYALTKQQLLSMDIVLHRLLHLNRVWLTSSKMASAAKPWLTDPISLQKKGLRKEMTAKLADVTAEEAERQSALVAEKVLSSVWFKNAKRVSVYTHTAGEIQTAKIIEESLKAGKHVFIPKSRFSGREATAVETGFHVVNM
ncbi:5-formyltetrahydrofolate cyclo-ligase, partial [Ancylostoma ceylanicum]